MGQAQRAAQAQLRWARGHRMTVHDWVLQLEGASAPQFNELGTALEYGVRTGHFPCWQRAGEYDRVLTLGGQVLSNVQARRLFAEAAERLDDFTTAGALRALQAVFGVTVR